MDARRLNLVLGAIALVATGTAIALAVRPDPAATPLPRAPAPVEDEAPAAPRAPGGLNAIAARALESGGPRAPTVSAGEFAPKHAIGLFATAFDLSAPEAALSCVTTAGDQALTRLGAASAATGGLPTVNCGGSGPDHIDGRVRVATRPVPGDKPGAEASRACEATVSYTLKRAGAEVARQELRGEPVTGDPATACADAVRALQEPLRERLARAGGAPG